MEEKEAKRAEAQVEEQVQAEDSPVLNELLSTLELGTESALDAPTQVLASDAAERMKAGDVVYASLRLLVEEIKERQKETGKVIVRSADVDACISKIDELMSRQMDQILHHPTFQKMESAWRGVEYLIKRTNFRMPVRLELMDVSKEELAEDFAMAFSLDQSQFFKRVYSAEYGTYGGIPYAAVVGNYEIENTADDLTLLRGVAQVGAAAHSPFIASVGPKFFGRKSVEELARVKDITRIFESKRYIAWNEFRKDEVAKYVGLTLPRFQLRNPYDPQNIKNKSFDHKETGH